MVNIMNLQKKIYPVLTDPSRAHNNAFMDRLQTRREIRELADF